jgi:hypothetical protein
MNNAPLNFALSDLQAWMQDALVHTGATTLKEDILAHIEPSNTLTALQRLAIYQRGYYARLVQCMEGQFKALCHALGRELFDDFAREYLELYPSQSPTLSDLGTRFPGYLASTRPDKEDAEKEEWIDFMVDLAQFEWDLYVVFDAIGNEGNPYATEACDDDKLSLQPCFSLHTYRFPVSVYYNEVARGNDPEIPFRQQCHIAIARKDYSIGIFTLLPAQYTFLSEMKKGATINETLATAASQFNATPEVAAKAWQEWRQHWIMSGFFVAAA